MKQVPINLFISTILLGLVFVVANTGAPNADASVARAPSVVVDSMTDGQMRLRGNGFRPGSLVNVRLQHRTGTGPAVASANAWVDPTGSFVADLDIQRLSRANTPTWDDFVVLATSSSGVASIPVAPPIAHSY